MRQPSGVAAFVISLLLSACSPYVYKDEVRGFATGVDNLTAAYAASTAAVNDLTRSAQRDLWVSRRASLAMTIGCTPAASGPCAVHEVGQQVPAPTQTQTAAADAAVVFTALKDYASALAMIVNAEDRDALDKATGELQDSVTNLAKRFEPTSPAPGTLPVAPRAGAVAGLFGQIAATGLDQRRFEALRAGVVSADRDMPTLAEAATRTLNLLTTARINSANREALAMERGFVKGLSEDDYRSRMTAFEAKVEELQGLRSANPAGAADQMVTAHGKLRAALEDPTTQISEVSKAVKAFVEKAKAVRTAFTPPVTAGSE